MPRFMSPSLQKRLISFGIIPSLSFCFFNGIPLYAVDEAPKKGSLVILEGRQQGKVPEGANLQQKVQFLTALANEQADKIRVLKDEIQNLKNKLHVAQLTLFSEEKGNYKQLYAALKRETAQIKETKEQLEKLAAQLKVENQEKSRKNEEDDAHIVSLMTALESHAFAFEKIKEKYQQELANLTTPNGDTKLDQLKKIILQLKKKNKLERQKNEEAAEQIKSLMAALENQQPVKESSSKDSQYKQLYAALEKESLQNKEKLGRLQKLAVQLKRKNRAEIRKNAENESHLSDLMTALEAQSIHFQQSESRFQEELARLYPEIQAQAAWKKQIAENQEKHDKLQKAILQLKKRNKLEKQKNEETEAHLISLMTALEAVHLAGNQNEKGEGELYSTLVQQTTENQQKQAELQEIIQQLTQKNRQEMLKNAEAQAQLKELIAALEFHQVNLKEDPYFKHLLQSSPFDYGYDELEYLKNENEAKQQRIFDHEEELKRFNVLLTQLEEELNQEKIKNTQRAHPAMDQELTALYAALEEETLLSLLSSKNASNHLALLESNLRAQQESLHSMQDEHEAKMRQMVQWQQVEKSPLPVIDNELSILYTALEEENALSLLGLKSTHNHLALLESNLHTMEQSLNSLQNEYEEKMQQIVQSQNSDQLQKLNELESQLALVYTLWESEKGLEQHPNAAAGDHRLSGLMDVLETTHLQHQLLASDIQIERDEKVVDLLARLDQEREKTALVQKNLDELQHIYDQTVVLYNEIYSDHKGVQKQLEDLTRDLDDNKMNHLVQIDGLEAKLENLAHELKNEQEKAKELEARLFSAQTNATELKTYENERQQIIADAEQIKQAYLSHLDAEQLQENLLRETYQEINHQKKIIADQEQILERVYQDKQTLAKQLQAIPLTAEEIEELQKKHEQLKTEVADLKALYHQHLQVNAVEEDLFNQANLELENYRLAADEYESKLRELLSDNEGHKVTLKEKNDEIDLLIHKMKEMDDQFKIQFQEFTALLESEKNKSIQLQKNLENHQELSSSKEHDLQKTQLELEKLRQEIAQKEQALLTDHQGYASLLETEKNKNSELQKELASHQEKANFHQQNLEKISLELEKLHQELVQRDQTLLVHKIEAEELSERLRLANIEKEKMQQQMQALEDGQTVAYKRIDQEAMAQQIALLKEQYQEEVNKLKQHYDEKWKAFTEEGEMKMMAVQLERLQEALQQMISEKTILQSQYQSQLFNEKMLTEKLEETMSELEKYKTANG